MSRPRAKDRVDTRERALDAAEALLPRLGYLGVSMDAIAAEVGVTKPSLYYHFPGGKEELFMTLMRRNLRRTEAEMVQAILSAERAGAQLRAVMVWWFAQSKGSSRQVREAGRHMAEDHQRELAKAVRDHLFKHIHAVMTRGVEEGDFRPHDTGTSTWMFLVLLSEMAGGEAQVGMRASAEEVAELFLGGITA